MSTKHISKLWFVAIIAILTIAILPIKSLSQEIIPSQANISFSVSPEFPEPEGTVTIEAASFNTDLNLADFKWTVNNVQIASGKGVRKITANMGKQGVSTTIVVSITATDGVETQRQFVFKPATVTLLSESSSYTPPFYKGLPLGSRGGSVTIVAIPEFFDSKGNRLNPKNLVYNWKQNGEAMGNSSGYGRDSIIINQTSYLRSSDTISVDVYSPTNNTTGRGSIEISMTETPIVLYENIPSLGTLFNRAIVDTYIFNKKEVTFVEVPYFISSKTSISPMINTEWMINNNLISKFTGKDRITVPLTQPGNGTLNVSVRHTVKVMQGGDTSILVTIPN